MTKQHIRLLIWLLLATATVARAQPGGWAVNASKYQYSMTTVAQIRVNGVPNHLLNNYLAVYFQGQFRGYAAPVKFNGQTYYFLNLYSNQYKDEALSFRAFIGADQKIYEAAVPLLFKHHKAVGTIAAPYQIDLTLGQRPLIYSLPEVDYAEGTCNEVLDVQASDNSNLEGNGLTYTLLAGGDASRFYINSTTGLLSWNGGFVPDFEMPADANGDNRYELRVRVTDVGGLFDEQDITVTVVKPVPPPPLVCPQNLSVATSDDGAGNCTSTAIGLSIASATLCESYSLAYQLSGATTGSGTGPLPFSQAFGKGVTTVTYTRTGAGAGQCSFTVTVSDNELPSITCPANIVRSTDPNLCTAIVTYAVNGNDNCTGSSTARTDGPASATAFPKGTTLVAWKITDGAGQMAQCAFTVTVNDTQLPSITCPSNIVRSNDANLCSAVVTYATPTFSDNCTGATAAHVSGGTSGTTFPKGATTVQWKATDAGGLTKTCTFTVTVNDSQQPTITCPVNQTKTTDPNLCTAVATYANPTATDNCPGVAVAHVSGGVSGAVFPKGQTTVVWRATDGAGLTKTCSFRITVNDGQAPNITCPSNQAKNTDPNLCTAVVTYANATFTDNCPGGSVLRTSGLPSGSVFPKGTNAVVWRATDAVGLTKTCSFTVTVTDAQLPTITCPPSVSVTAPPGQCSAVVTYTTPTATDNCAVQSKFLLNGLASGSLFPQGVTTTVWRAVDNGGASSTCAFTVTVACGASQENSEFEVRSSKLEGGTVPKGDLTTFKKLSNLALRLAPNPAFAQVEIGIENLGENGGELTVFDPQGREVWQQAVTALQSTVTLDVCEGKFAAGLYFVALRSEGGTVTKRLVVSR